MNKRGYFELKISEGDPTVAYLNLPTYPEKWPAKVKKTIRLLDVIGTYKGPDIMLDFDDSNTLVGIELLAE